MSDPITIIGTGLAGYNLARELRKQSPDAELRILTADGGDFYSKPMLSNALAGGKTAAQLAVKSAAKMAEELRADVRVGVRVQALHPTAHRITTDAGDLSYGKLVLAIGASPFVPAMGGDGAADVLTVNNLDDYALFRQRIEWQSRVLLLGAGLIGCEFANDLRSRAIEVDVVDLAAWPLPRLLPEAAGRRLQDALTQAGVRFHLGTSIQSIERLASGGYRATLANNGQPLVADVILSAVGLRPRVDLARAAGLAVRGGIVVNRLLRSSDPDIYALGDCAEVEGHVLPFVLPLMHCARALAATLAGRDTPVAYPAMPVVVKTPACPTAICPPPVGVSGGWQIDSADDSLRALFRDDSGQLRGFVVMGSAAAERAALAAQIPPLLPA